MQPLELPEVPRYWAPPLVVPARLEQPPDWRIEGVGLVEKSLSHAGALQEMRFCRGGHPCDDQKENSCGDHLCGDHLESSRDDCLKNSATACRCKPSGQKT